MMDKVEKVEERNCELDEFVEERDSAHRKPFVKPMLIRHESLPEVTTGFVGSFVP